MHPRQQTLYDALQSKEDVLAELYVVSHVSLYVARFDRITRDAESTGDMVYEMNFDSGTQSIFGVYRLCRERENWAVRERPDFLHDVQCMLMAYRDAEDYKKYPSYLPIPTLLELITALSMRTNPLPEFKDSTILRKIRDAKFALDDWETARAHKSSKPLEDKIHDLLT